jgi:hypothetical protein
MLEKKSNQQRPKNNNSVERRAGIELGGLRGKRWVAARADFLSQGDDSRRWVARQAHGLGRYAGRRQDRLATRLRANARPARWGVMATETAAAAIEVMVRIGLRKRRVRPTAMGVADGIAAGGRMAFSAARQMPADKLELAVGAHAGSARQTGPQRQGNHSPSDDSRQACAKKAHSQPSSSSKSRAHLSAHCAR